MDREKGKHAKGAKRMKQSRRVPRYILIGTALLMAALLIAGGFFVFGKTSAPPLGQSAANIVDAATSLPDSKTADVQDPIDAKDLVTPAPDTSQNGAQILTTSDPTQNPDTPTDDRSSEHGAPPSAPPTVDPNIPVVNEYGIYSRSALLIDLETEKVLFDYKSADSLYPASLVKMMTAIISIELLPDLNMEVTVTSDMIDGLKEAGASRIGFKEGEAVSVIDLLYGVMVYSGADAANAVAVAAAGSTENFVVLMNKKSAELDLYSTNFVNVHGLHDPKQVSTAVDLAALLRYCLKNETFKKIFTTTTHFIAPTEFHPDGIKMSNSLMAALKESDLEGKEYMLGSKTGFTTPAGQCLASLARINGREYILITLNAGKTGYNHERYNMLDAVYLYNTVR